MEIVGGARIENKDDKLMFSLIPIEMLKRVAERYTMGAKTHGARNMEQGNQEYIDKRIDSAWRHFIAYMEGDESEDHLAGTIWNLFTIEFLKNKLAKEKDFSIDISKDYTDFTIHKQIIPNPKYLGEVIEN